MNVQNAAKPTTPATTQVASTPTAATTEVKPAEVKTTSVQVTKETAVADRTYTVMARSPISFRGKQRQITYDILMENDRAMTIKEIAVHAAAKGLVATGGVEPSVRYHLHYLAKDANNGAPCVIVTNPTYTVTVETPTK